MKTNATRSIAAIVTAAAALHAGLALAAPEAEKPHVVILFADDLGYGDVQALNPASAIPTPNLNRLAAEGMVLTDAHTTSAVCTPSRYGLLTGRYSFRSRLPRGVFFPPKDFPLIAPERLTLAGLLKQAGYHSACIGKWHLGVEWARDDAGAADFSRPVKVGPTDTGFDQFFGVIASLDMIPYLFYRNLEPTAPVVGTQPAQPFPRFVRKGPIAEGFDPGRVLDDLTREAVTYIRGRAETRRPFFLYFPLTGPHKPVWPAERFIGRTTLGPYGDFVHQVDACVGEVLDTLDELGLAEHTLVFFSSDNGSFMYRRPAGTEDHVADPSHQLYAEDHHTANGPWRGTKADIWEGGHRVPTMVRWPGRVAPGKRSEVTVCLTDVFATLAEVAGIKMPDACAEDSFSLLPVLTGEAESFKRAPVIHNTGSGMFAVREGRWKLVLGNGSGGRERPAGKPFQPPYQLYDLQADPGETKDVSEVHPDVVARLTEVVTVARRDGRTRPGVSKEERDVTGDQ